MATLILLAVCSLLTEEWARSHMYIPFTQHRHRPQAGRYVNIAPQGFRLLGQSSPAWLPPDDRLNIFVFDGSTTYGAGVADRVLGVRSRLFPSRESTYVASQQPGPSTVSQEARNARALSRYLANQRMIRALASAFDVEVVFVWQPHPTYKYNRANHLFGVGEAGEEAGRRDARFAEMLARLGDDTSLVWLADMQETLNEPLYVDRVHYTAGFSRRIAEEISKRLFEREPFVSRSPH